MDRAESFRGLIWYHKGTELDINVIGCGGVGSWLVFLLNRLNPGYMTIYDPDIIENRNLSGQLFSKQQIGTYKVSAIREIIDSFETDHNMGCKRSKYIYEDFKDVTFIGVDSFKSRREVINNVKSPLIIDGRLDAEKYQIYTICEGVEHEDKILTYGEALELYKEKHLPKDEEFPDQICTVKQTSHWAASVASEMVKQYTRYLYRLENIPITIKFKMEDGIFIKN